MQSIGVHDMKKYIKRIIIAAVIVIVAVFTGMKIYGSTVSGIVSTELKTIKNEQIDTSTLAQTYSLDTSLNGKLNDVIEKVLDFDYDIQSKSVKGNTATVKVKITTYDFAKAFDAASKQIAKDKKSGKIKTTTITKKYASKVMFNAILALDDKTCSNVVTIKCTKGDDGKWTTNAATNKALMNAIFGGLVSALNGATD